MNKAEAKEQRQYGVEYPDGRTFWVSMEKGGTSLPGVFGMASLATAEERGKFIDTWHTAVAGLGLDPEGVAQPKFVSRSITTTFGESTSVGEA